MAFETTLSVKVDASGASRGSRQVTSALNRMGTAGVRSVRKLQGAFSKLRGAVFNMKTAVASVITLLTGTQFAQINARFEDLRESLSVVFGSQGAGAQAFNRIQDLAATMPISVEAVTQAFITLKATGIEPTTELLTTFSDAASVTTDRLGSFQAMVRVFSRGVQGGLGLEELNQIADRGLPVWDILQDKLGRNRLELSELGKTAKGAKVILDALSQGIQERFGGATANALDNLSTKMSNFGDAFNRMVDETLRGTGGDSVLKDLIDKGTVALGNFRNGVFLATAAFQEVFRALDFAADRLIAKMKAIFEYIKDMSLDPLRVWEAQGGVFDAFENMSDRIKQRAQGMLSGAEITPPSAAGIPETPGATEIGIGQRIPQQLKDQVDLIKRRNTAMKQGSAALEEFDRLQQVSDDVKVFQRQAKDAGLLGQQLDNTVETYRKLRVEQDELTKALERQQRMMKPLEDAFDRLGDSIVDSMTSGKDAMESMRSVVRDLANGLLKMMMQMFVMEPIKQAIMGSASSLFSGGMGGVDMGAPKVGYTAAKGGVFTNGVVTRPTIFPMANGAGLMGEAGPEAVMPLKRGPDGKLGVSGGGGGTTVYIDARGSNGDMAVEEAVQRGIRAAAPGLVNASVQRVRGERRRDPNFFGRDTAS